MCHQVCSSTFYMAYMSQAVFSSFKALVHAICCSVLCTGGGRHGGFYKCLKQAAGTDGQHHGHVRGGDR